MRLNELVNDFESLFKVILETSDKKRSIEYKVFVDNRIHTVKVIPSIRTITIDNEIVDIFLIKVKIKVKLASLHAISYNYKDKPDPDKNKLNNWNRILSLLVLENIDEVIKFENWKNIVNTTIRYLTDEEKIKLIESIRELNKDKYVELVLEVM